MKSVTVTVDLIRSLTLWHMEDVTSITMDIVAGHTVDVRRAHARVREHALNTTAASVRPCMGVCFTVHEANRMMRRSSVSCQFFVTTCLNEYYIVCVSIATLR